MAGVFEGFFTIAALIAAGFVLARVKILDATAQQVLAHFAFWVASPALLLTVMARTPVSDVLGPAIATALLSVVVTVTAYLVVARLTWRPGLGDGVIQCLCAAYVNSGNLGIPIAQYVIGDVKAAAPILLMQLLGFTPIAMALLDADARGQRPSLLVGLGSAVRNPISVCALAGLVLSVTGIHLPRVVMEPINLLGGMAVPAMLIAFGISLAVGPGPGRGAPVRQLATLVGFKLVVQPVAAFGIAYAGFGLRGHALFSALVLASLPTAQNIFVYASHYNRAPVLARDAIFVSTLGSAPLILGIAVAFH